MKDLNQEDYGLKIIEDLGMFGEKPNRKRRAIFECPICFNGYEAEVYSVSIGDSTRCKKCRNITHNLTGHKLYSTWASMKDRCYNKNSDKFHRYGGRGISVCDEWKDSFIAYKDYVEGLSDAYKDTFTLDRTDNDDDYRIGNISWEPKTTQSRNTVKLRVNNTSGYRGVFSQGKRWIVKITVNCKSIGLGTYDTAIEGAKAYDKYVIANKLEHTLNGV